jgi:thiamine-phosphate pyrophosphorylase
MAQSLNSGWRTVSGAARRLNARAGCVARHPLPPLLLLTDRERADALQQINRLPPGSAVILRDYRAPDRRALARRLRAETRTRRLLFLIAGDWRLAVETGADGLHLPEAMVAQRRAWRRAREGWLVTAAAHGPAALERAAAAGADAALLSPVFPTGSHPGARTLGPGRFAQLVRAAPLPVYALGGLGGETAQSFALSGAAGLAGVTLAETGAG